MTVITKNIAALAVSVLVLSGCGSTSKVLNLGPDTYRVTASKHNMSGGAPAAEEAALQSASQHCVDSGKNIYVTNTTSSFDRPFYSYSVNFRCLSAGDPDLQRPSYRSAPDLIIETR